MRLYDAVSPERETATFVLELEPDGVLIFLRPRWTGPTSRSYGKISILSEPGSLGREGQPFSKVIPGGKPFFVQNLKYERQGWQEAGCPSNGQNHPEE